MKSARPFLIACGVFFALIPTTEVQCQTPQHGVRSETGWKWLGEKFHLVLDHTLPLEKGSHILIAYRSYETLQVGDIEYSLSIFDQGGDGRRGLSAHVRLPDGQPIGEQLLLFHRNHPMGLIGAAEKSVNFKDWFLTEQQCPSLTTAIQKLEQIRFGLPTNKIVLDPTVHEFSLSSAGGNVHAVLVDIENPLVQWGLETRRAIQACGAGNLPTKKSDDGRRE